MNSRYVSAIGITIAVGVAAAQAIAQGDGVPDNTMASLQRMLPKIETHVAPGYRLYRPGYRLSGKGALVTTQLCRLPGWAGQGPTRLEIQRVDPSGAVAEIHTVYLPRLGMRSYNNCTSNAAKLDGVPDYGETIRICALSGGRRCK